VDAIEAILGKPTEGLWKATKYTLTELLAFMVKAKEGK
jgi:hypothetical protein